MDSSQILHFSLSFAIVDSIYFITIDATTTTIDDDAEEDYVIAIQGEEYATIVKY